jgi:hypothetical protein
MNGGEHSETGSNKANEGHLPVSRRAVLASSAAAGAAGLTGTAAAEEENGTRAAEQRASLSSLLLRQGDLADPDAYVTWSIDAAAAPLPRHLASAVERFEADAGAMSGFVATADADGPDAVESAAFPARGQAAVATAADEWVRTRRGDGGETTRLDTAKGFQWETTTADGGLDVLRLQRVPDALAFAGASGEAAARGDFRKAVDRYADVMRRRAMR